MSLRTRSFLAVACLGLLASALVSACSDDDDANDETASGGDAPAATATDTPAPSGGVGAPTSGTGGGSGTGSGAAPPAFPASDEPPSTTASANGQTAEMGLGTYCWTLMCVDKIGVPTKGALTVASGDTVSVAIPAGTTLREASANTFAAKDAQELDDGSEIWPYPGNPGEAQEYAISGNKIDVMVDLAPGTYVLAVGMYFEAGDAQYGVLLEVE